jgi:hypothetical protein
VCAHDVLLAFLAVSRSGGLTFLAAWRFWRPGVSGGLAFLAAWCVSGGLRAGLALVAPGTGAL